MTTLEAGAAPRWRHLAATVGAVIGAFLGVLAEDSTHVADSAVWGPDLAVGWTFLGCGLLAWARRPASRTGLLLSATGVAWFLPNFSFVSSTPLSWVAGHSLYLYLGPLVQLLVTFPSGRDGSRLQRGAVVAGYVAAFATPVWRSDPTAIVLAGALLGVVYTDFRRARGRPRLARRTGLLATGLTALVLAGGAAARLFLPGDHVLGPTRWAVMVWLCVVAVWLVASLLLARWDTAIVTDLVVELGEAPSDGLRDDLARALGDPSLRVGYWVVGDRWMDARGQDFLLPAADAARSVTVVRGDEHPIAALIHDPAVLDNPALVEAIRTTTRLAVAHARLQAEVRAQVAELAASRLRLLEAADDERRRLEQRLHDGARRRLEELGTTTLSRARASTQDQETGSRLEVADAELQDSLHDLLRLARGLHPRELGELGLDGALRALARRSPLPVSVRVETAQVPPAPAAAAYYVCLEGLTNVVKHAQASSVSVLAVAAGEQLCVEVVDDGVGGASGDGGAGLRGLADRVEALGGSLSIESTGGEGTRLAARIPLGRRAPAEMTADQLARLNGKLP